MVLSLHKWRDRLKLVMILIVLAVLAYHLLPVMDGLWQERRYDQPSGRAIKAYAPVDAALGGADFSDRLRFFYWYGE